MSTEEIAENVMTAAAIDVKLESTIFPWKYILPPFERYETQKNLISLQKQIAHLDEKLWKTRWELGLDTSVESRGKSHGIK